MKWPEKESFCFLTKNTLTFFRIFKRQKIMCVPRWRIKTFCPLTFLVRLLVKKVPKTAIFEKSLTYYSQRKKSQWGHFCFFTLFLKCLLFEVCNRNTLNKTTDILIVNVTNNYFKIIINLLRCKRTVVWNYTCIKMIIPCIILLFLCLFLFEK